MQNHAFCTAVSSPFGLVGIVWQEGAGEAKVRQILLPGESAAGGHVVTSDTPAERRDGIIAHLAEKLQAYLEGEPVLFDVDILALDACSPFQRRVLLAEHGIPRGWVSTYGRIAAALGAPGAARAVGTALARNPFPIVIPCHRAVRADGALGGFRGGLPMKRALLAMEGVPFLQSGKVRMEQVYY